MGETNERNLFRQGEHVVMGKATTKVKREGGSCFIRQKIMVIFSPFTLFVLRVCVCACGILPQMIDGKDELDTILAESRWYHSEASIVD